MKALRKPLYWALLPLQWLADLVNATGRVFWFLLIVSNPLFLALWLMNRDTTQRQDKEAP